MQLSYKFRVHHFLNVIEQVSHPGRQVFAVNVAQVVGSSRDIFPIVNLQVGQQHHQLVIITHLSRKKSQVMLMLS